MSKRNPVIAIRHMWSHAEEAVTLAHGKLVMIWIRIGC